MEVKNAIKERRAYRSLEEFPVTENIIKELAEAAALAPSCYNNQPWRFVFIYEEDKLTEFYSALSEGNSWAKDGSMIIAVFSNRDDDCISGKREYYLFDTGLATANLILRATEMNLVAHPMAGFDEEEAKEILNIPVENRLITIIGVGKHDEKTEIGKKETKQRPPRKDIKEFVFHNQVPIDYTRQ